MHQLVNSRRRELPIYFGVVILLLIVGFLFGLTNPSRFRAQLSPSLKQLVNSMPVHHSASWLHTFWLIFLHNATSALELSLFGLAFGLIPAYMMWMNGLLSGFVVGTITEQHGIPAWETIVYGLLPHGIFELTAIFWAAALGIANGLAVIRAISLRMRRNLTANGTTRDTKLSFREAHPLRFSLLRTVRSLPVIWALLLVAAVIESAITPHVMAWGIPALHKAG